jgi:drug/metabolite transporter (DMT)-like permease
LATAVGVRHLPPFLFGGVRFVLSGLILLGVSRLLGNRPQLDAREWRNLAWVALGWVVLSNGCNVWAMQYVSSNQTALLNATAALWIAWFASYGRRAHALDRRTAIGLVLGFGGTVMILWRSGAAAWRGSGGHFGPELVILLGVIGWAMSTVYMRNAVRRIDLLSFTALQMLLGGLVLTMLGFATGEVAEWQWSRPGVLALLYMMVFSSGIAYTAYAWLTQHTTPAVVGTYSYVNPALAAMLGWWFLDERLNASQLIGMIVMLVGVVLVTRPTAAADSRTAADEGHGA